MRFHFLPPTLCLLAASSLLPSCKKAEISIYDVPKEERLAAQATDMAGASLKAEGGHVSWTAPSHWQSLAPTPFRKGNYRLESEAGAMEVTVSSFPGDVGGLLANVNRWLGQAGLPAIQQIQLNELATQKRISGQQVTLVDLNADSQNGNRIYAAIVKYAGESWFFKMSGPGKVVEGQIAAFDAMIDDLRFSNAASMPPSQTAKPAAADKLTFTPPEGWTPTTGSSLRIASFEISKEGFEPADFSITSFPGDTGGTVKNVNRWRRQVGLQAWDASKVAEEERTLLTEDGLKFQIFDLKPDAGEGNSDQRILVAILKHAGKSWFFKLRGEVFLVQTQTRKFDALLESVHFHAEGDNHAH